MAKKITQRDIILWHLQNVGTLTRAQGYGRIRNC